MIVYVSMILWIPLVYFFYSLNHKEEIKLSDYNLSQGKIVKAPIGYCILIFGFFVFWIGLRGSIADTGADIWNFNRIPSDFSTAWSNINWYGRCPGYDVFNVLFKCFISQDSQVWLMSIAIICGICMLIGIRRYSCDFFYSAYLFMTLLIFWWMINGMRQFICVSIMFAFSHWIEQGKFIRFFILTLLLFSIHVSAIILIPIYLMARGTPWKGKTIILIGLVILVSLFSDYFFRGAEQTIGGTNYQGYTDQFATDDGVNVLRVLFTAIFPVLAFIKRRKLEQYYQAFPILPICINCSLITTAIFFVAMFTSGILVGRLPVYTEVFNMILIPYLLKLGFSKEERHIVTPILTIVLFVYFWLKIPHTYYSDVLNIVIDNRFI